MFFNIVIVAFFLPLAIAKASGRKKKSRASIASVTRTLGSANTHSPFSYSQQRFTFWSLQSKKNGSSRSTNSQSLLYQMYIPPSTIQAFSSPAYLVAGCHVQPAKEIQYSSVFAVLWNASSSVFFSRATKCPSTNAFLTPSIVYRQFSPTDPSELTAHPSTAYRLLSEPP